VFNSKKTDRRSVLKAGLASLAGIAILTPEGHTALPTEIRPKAPGETKVVFLGGDVLHNFMAQEPALRSICEKAGWKFYAAHDSRYITPEFIKDADLLMILRWGGPVPGTVSGPIYTQAPTNDDYMSDALEDAIVDNVRNRGMGYMSLHCGIWNMSRKKYMDLLGVNAIIHGPLQMVHLHNFNQNHPISKGMPDFDIAEDENFGAELINKDAIPLYEITGFQDKRHDYGGWCIEQGKGRVVGLLAGHTYFAFEDSNYLKLYRRAAYWALKKEVPQD
jgi:type 1 glutamine amidotransferase